MLIEQILNPSLAQYSYILACEKTREAIIIDPLRDVGPLLEKIQTLNLTLVAVTETHIHADFLSGTLTLHRQHHIPTYLSSYGGEDWHYRWPEKSDHIQWLKQNDRINIGESLSLEVIHTPGHTPEHIIFKVYDHHNTALGVITGDFIFADDLGRPDLLEKAAHQSGQMAISAQQLFQSIQQCQQWPPELILWPGHGAGSSCGKSLGARPYTTWGYEQSISPILGIQNEDEFCQNILQAQKEPPLYFARMKHSNRDGTPSNPLKPCQHLKDPTVLNHWFKHEKPGYILDLYHNISDYLAQPPAHSLWTPLANILTAVGSLIEEANTPLLLLVDNKSSALQAQQQLYLIGFDQVVGFITPEQLPTTADQSQSTIATLTFSKIKAYQETQDSMLVDVRTSPEYQHNGFAEALNAPYQRLPEHLAQLPKDKTLLIHCQSGARAAVCSSYLHNLGYQVLLVQGSKPHTLG